MTFYTYLSPQNLGSLSAEKIQSISFWKDQHEKNGKVFMLTIGLELDLHDTFYTLDDSFLTVSSKDLNQQNRSRLFYFQVILADIKKAQSTWANRIRLQDKISTTQSWLARLGLLNIISIYPLLQGRNKGVQVKTYQPPLNNYPLSHILKILLKNFK